MKKILVTGGAGFIGSHLVEKLVNNNEFVVVLDNFDLYYDPKLKYHNLEKIKNKNNFKLVVGDIRDAVLVDKIIDEYRSDTIIHLAAKVGVRNSIENPQEYFDVNVLGTLNLLEAAKNNKIKNFIFTSSSSVYGENKKIPFSENDPTNRQLSPYAISKKTAELYCQLYSLAYNIPITILRLFTVYGLRMRPDLAISKFIKKIKNNDEIEIYGDGTATRDFIYINDVINGFIEAIKTPFKFEIFNLGGSNPLSINCIIKNLEQIIGIKAKRKYFSTRPEDMPITHADIKKAKNFLKWHSKINIKEGLKRTVGC